MTRALMPSAGRRGSSLPARSRKSARFMSGLDRVEPAEVDREALAGQQRRGLVQRQTDDVGVGADDFDDEDAGEPLRRIAAGLAAPFAGGEIGLDVLLRQPLEAHAGLDQPLAESLFRRHQADASVNAMVAAR